MTTQEAARRAEISVHGIRDHIRRGNLKARRIGRDWDIYEKSFERWLETPRKPGRRRKPKGKENGK